jgi:glycine/D-amino acid oxidase-like deaminating enzyme
MPPPVVAVIGAGIVGCLAACEIAARDPAARVIVLDREAVGAGASRRSAGLHIPRGASPRTRRMSAYSHAYYADLRLRRPGLPIQPVGATVITSRAPGGRLGGGYLDVAAPVPVPAPVPLPAPVPAPALAGGPPPPGGWLPAGARAWRIAGCHYAEVSRLAQLIAADLRPRVRFLEGVAVTGLASAAGGVTVHLGTGERLAADRVVLAPGPWLSVPAWRHLLAPLRLRVKKVAALHIEQRPGPADEAAIFDDEDAFLLPLADRGHWLFSYTSRDWDVDPDALAGGLSAADLEAARDCLRRYSPALADACRSGRVFCDAYSPGQEPLVGAVDGPGRIVFAGAASGSGYRLAPAIGAQAADLLHLPPGPTQLSEGVTGDHQYV